MSYVITVIVFILIFSFLILIHELGHFVMAKRAGIKVEEFGFGLPPRMWGKKKGETIYSLNWIPFGGFVRLFGEDSSDPKMMKSKRSYAGKPMRARVKVVVAGVVMNFLVAWILLSVGFSVGMQPLLAADDVLGAINKGQIVLETGLKIKTIDEGSVAQKIGMSVDDTIYAIDGVIVNDSLLVEMKKDPVGDYSVLSGGEPKEFKVTEDVFASSTEKTLGVGFYEFASFPRVKIYDLMNHTDAYRFGLRSGDILLSVNGEQIYNVREFEELTRGEATLELEVLRSGVLEDFIVERNEVKQIVASEILPNTPAAEIGLQAEDIIVSVNGKNMTDGAEFVAFVDEHKDENLSLGIQRHGQKFVYQITPGEDGKVGVMVSELISYGADQGMSLYNIDLLESVKEVKDEKYPVHIAAYKALGETYKLSKLTVGMFGDFIGSLVKTGEVPDSVAGPVGIAQMTHVFVQEGIVSLLRFVALLSLSLGVINILPFPALDGGRLLFILIEFIMGKPIPQKWESKIHVIGYVLILFMILAVTYSDILRLFTAG